MFVKQLGDILGVGDELDRAHNGTLRGAEMKGAEAVDSGCRYYKSMMSDSRREHCLTAAVVKASGRFSDRTFSHMK